ncbi:MAG: hypothetical protein PHV82_12630, partial [Victivallaceae bacterium]|nr:hypothetical protein [Victivallaceae bacterium]
STGFWASCAAVWGFTAALLACPITWIVVGIAALAAGIVALIYYWDEVCGWVMKYSDYLLMLLGPIGWTAALLIRFWDDIVAGAEWCYNKITGWFTGLWDFGRNIVSGIFQWIVGKITGFLDWMTKIPIIGGTIKSGLDALKDFAGMEVTQTAKVERPVVPSVRAARNNDIRAGGINNTSNKTNNWGGVTINTQNPVGPGEMEDMWALQA